MNKFKTDDKNKKLSNEKEKLNKANHSLHGE